MYDKNALPVAARLNTPLYESVARLVPAREVHYVQLGPGSFRMESDVAGAFGVWMLRDRFETLTAHHAVPEPGLLAFGVPVRWSGEFTVNGQQADPTSLFVMSGPDGYASYAESREVIVVGLDRERFVRRLAALDGTTPDRVCVHDGRLVLGRQNIVHVRQFLRERLDEQLAGRSPLRLGREPELTDEVFNLLLEAYVAGRPRQPAEPAPSARPQQIIRLVHDFLDRVRGQPVALADLCAAAGVGRKRLHRAFSRQFGMPPMTYIRKRRLMEARVSLLSAPPGRSVVKRVALEVGLTHLGRFSTEYRELFGETPTETLTAGAGRSTQVVIGS